MIWSLLDLVLETKEVTINPHLVADHNPVEWEINTKQRKKLWRFNNVYWQDENFKNQIRKVMEVF